MAEIATDYGIPLSTLKKLIEEKNTKESFPNGIRVSKTDNPLFFPVSNTYQIGSSEIVALCSNAIAVGTGQTGAAPLYVFAKDGLYALFVDSSGEIAYTNSRIIARDVCNNSKSVTPTDSGVVFTTDRGLMCIAGERVEEIGQPLEGDWCRFVNSDHTHIDWSNLLERGYKVTKLADLSSDTFTKTDFLHYLKGSIVAYNHNERELMVSNTEKNQDGSTKYPYTYILDREGNWSRRDYSADEYVNNYPTTYRLSGGKLYQVDENSDDDNGVFLLTKELKLDSIGFKELHRVVARGWFETKDANHRATWSGSISNGSITIFNRSGNSLIEKLTNGTIKIEPSGLSTYSIKFTYVDGTTNQSSPSGGTIGFSVTNCDNIQKIEIITSAASASIAVVYSVKHHLDLYVQGSYDGRKWSTLGVKRNTGKFTDIGCIVERNDCRYFRICLAGYISKDSRLDYFEVSSKQSKLGTKIR